MLTARRIIIVLELIVGVLAVAGGVALIARPNGTVLGFDVSMLHQVFESFLVPGISLVAMGLLNLAAALMTWRRFMWDHVLSAVAAGALVLWISVQVAVEGFDNWTQPMFFAIGTVVFYLATELWREGEGPHLGMEEGFEDLDLKNARDMPPAYRRSDSFRVLQLFGRRRA